MDYNRSPPEGSASDRRFAGTPMVASSLLRVVRGSVRCRKYCVCCLFANDPSIGRLYVETQKYTRRRRVRWTTSWQREELLGFALHTNSIGLERAPQTLGPPAAGGLSLVGREVGWRGEACWNWNAQQPLPYAYATSSVRAPPCPLLNPSFTLSSTPICTNLPNISSLVK